MKAVLIGNYGVGNFGDEVLREYFLEAFPDVEWTTLSQETGPGFLPHLPFGVRSLLRPWWKTIAAIRRTRLVVFGGGTLFTDNESLWACFVWGMHVCIARLLGAKVVLAFQGVGPFRTALGEGIARRALRRSAFVSVRDQASFDRVRAWGLSTTIVQTFDPIFLAFIRHKKEHRAQNVSILIPRKNSGKTFFDTIEKHAAVLSAGTVQILSFQPGDAGERGVVDRLHDKFPSASVRTIGTVDELMDVLSRGSICICERFHGALAAAAAGVPTDVVIQSEGDKLSGVRPLFVDAAAVGRAHVLAETGEKALSEALKVL